MPNKPKPPPKGWLWSEDAADYLGVHFTTLYRWRRDEIGPESKRHGQRRYRYKISDLDAWLNGDRAENNRTRAAA
ncbi:helix-turn-helix domain-containing protein [Streptomyces sp. NPDC050597]|uniref:helix-turn-helix transcriptional regulator n=1 Tax=Streptomyces TaxID=1883 RepID=UPI00224C8C1B|nr:helix-turn-helix domain-containing protein [Streptomyces phaeochromogenes]MCX5598349.1 helix-turn-helix domain-containing protein [Streptomyces phaeochromogenes]